MSEDTGFVFTKDNVNNNKVNFALSLLKGLNFDVNLLATYAKDCRFILHLRNIDIKAWYGNLNQIKYMTKEKDTIYLFYFEDLFDIFTDPTNPTPEDLTLFNLEYGVPWITELKPEDLV